MGSRSFRFVYFSQVMSIFTRLESSSAAQATRTAGIDKLLPSMVIDDYLFQPCGYSMNGISKNVCTPLLSTLTYSFSVLIVFCFAFAGILHDHSCNS